MTPDMVSRDYVLGLDIGSASVGWAMIGLTDSHAPTELIRAGVRIFEAGVEGNIQEGKDESKALARRTARLQRRQLRRFSVLEPRFSAIPRDARDGEAAS